MNTERVWKKIMYNEILESDGFYISYNPDCSKGLGGIMDRLMGDHQTQETAIVIADSTFLILDGDHRKEYEKRIESLESCIEYYKSNSHLWSPTTNESE